MGGQGDIPPYFFECVLSHTFFRDSGVDIFCTNLHGIRWMIGAIFVKFSQLILMKIIKIVATRCHIVRPQCTKFNFGWGSAPDPVGGAYSAPPDPLAAFKGPILKARRGKRGSGGRGRVPSTFQRIYINGSGKLLLIVGIVEAS